MLPDELAYASIRTINARFRDRSLSPVELTSALLRRIERHDSQTQAFVTLAPELALAAARRAEQQFFKGDATGPLLGIPVGYKDLIATKGVPTTAGSALLADWMPDADASCVARLQAAGSVMIGKLITHEFAFGVQFPGHRFPGAKNPWNLDHTPGGSSSGSGAALAAGMVVGALGTDTGGSIRSPASSCGITGLKPTYGRVSRAGVLPLSWSLDHVGPMARSAEDCAYLLQSIAGPDERDKTSSYSPTPDYVAALGGQSLGVRIGIPQDFFFDDVQPEVANAFDTAIHELVRLGASIHSVDIPSARATPIFLVILLCEAFAYHEENLRRRPELYGDVLREKLQTGALFTGSEYVQAQRLRERMRLETLDVFRNVDIIATPTTPSAAPPFSVILNPDFPFPRTNMAPFNLSGVPALALPSGFSTANLPLSLQLAGRPFEEDLLLRVGHAYQQVTDWHLRRPRLPSVEQP